MLKVASVVRYLGFLVASVIVIGIVLSVLDAKDQGLAGTWFDICDPLVDPFRGLLDLERPKAQLAANWGIAAAVWFAVALLVASVITRVACRRR
jgi:uncharacterized protein YggT (Ycf19 family)